MKKSYNVAVLRARGAVGQEMIKVLEEYQIPIKKLLPLASARSAGSKIRFCGQDVVIEEAKDESFDGMDFVLDAIKSIKMAEGVTALQALVDEYHLYYHDGLKR